MVAPSAQLHLPIWATLSFRLQFQFDFKINGEEMGLYQRDPLKTIHLALQIKRTLCPSNSGGLTIPGVISAPSC